MNGCRLFKLYFKQRNEVGGRITHGDKVPTARNTGVIQIHRSGILQLGLFSVS